MRAEARPQAPFGRRPCEVADSRASGGYHIFTLIDSEGPAPAPGQFYMLAAAPEWGGEGGRPYLPRAISYARVAENLTGGLRLDFLIDEVGPGTSRLARMEPGDSCHLTGPFGSRFSLPRELNPEAAGAILVGGGIGIAPMAVLRRELVDRGIPSRSLLGFRDQAHSGGVDELFGCDSTRLAFEDGSSGHKGYVTDLLLQLLEGDDASSAAVYSCGPPAMLEAVRQICLQREIPVELALESPMACGYGACFGCAVPKADGGYLRLCIDGPVVRGEEIATAMAGEPSVG
ncbi:MAG: dihydroorotate dehydrogenase electron transfer subunit [Solirubrobacterales bacterium]|nr:dihydroorotate dehydrogenase electron transfer subunit [Solirubrobacterales bacterium]